MSRLLAVVCIRSSRMVVRCCVSLPKCHWLSENLHVVVSCSLREIWRSVSDRQSERSKKVSVLPSKAWKNRQKGYFAFPKVSALLEPHHQTFYCHIQDTRWESVTPLQRCRRCILQPRLTRPMCRCGKWFIHFGIRWGIEFSVVLFFIGKSKYAGFSLLIETMSCFVFNHSCKIFGFPVDYKRRSWVSRTKMYSNNILNFQESTTILNTCTKKSGNLLKAPRIYYHFHQNSHIFWHSWALRMA